MGLTQLIVHAVIQAVAAIFPVGALGHQILISRLLDWPDPDPAFFVILRAGLLLAVLAYFWRDLADMVGGVIRAAKGKRDPGARLTLQVLVAAIPTLGLGFAFEQYVAGPWETLTLTGWCIIGFGVVLLLFDNMSMTVKRIEHASFADAIAISLCQVLGLIPGVAASAVAFIMARMLGYERAHAVRLSFLLVIPVWAAMIARDAYVLFEVDGRNVSKIDITAAAAGFVAALAAIAFLMAWLRRGTFTPFLIYRLLLGAAVLMLAYDVFSV